MNVPRDLLEILVCPESHAPLDYFPNGQQGASPGTILAGPFLFCRESRLAYPVHDGIPVMLVEEAQRLTEAEAESLSSPE